MALPVVEHLPDALRSARRRAGLSRETVAIEIGRTHPTVVAYEVGRAVPPLPILARLADLYGCTVAELIGEDA